MSVAYPCNEAISANFGVFLALAVLPFHILLLFTLAKDTLFSLPRHKILFSLSLSHVLQIGISNIIFLVIKAFSMKSHETQCIAMRRCIQFIAPLNLVVTSLNLIALSVERYVACVHGLRFHQIVTNGRVTAALALIWSLGFILAAFNFAIIRPAPTIEGQAFLSETPLLRVIAFVVEIPTCLTLIVIQAKLLAVSRKKLLVVQPGVSTSSQAEQRGLWKRQLKIAFVAGMVVVTYLVCTFPGALIALQTVITYGTLPVDKYHFTLVLWMANAVTDPFIYGFGMRDTRLALIKRAKRIFSALFCCLHSS
ncbi:melanocortin receptor 4-like [Rhopilema esculentum]|uniref:melanocortin receptor 4-like n=1 Tax=Rhopilema esculentum TaxID=499914 RepID=UPI0031D34A90|eukprot:gene15497-6753_t